MDGLVDGVLAALTAAVRAVDPRQAMREHLAIEGSRLRVGDRSYALADIDRIFVVGGGKAGAAMAAAAAEILGPRLTGGVVNVKYGHTAGGTGWALRLGRGGKTELRQRADTGSIALIEAGHPTPDAAGKVGTERMLGLLRGLTERDLVLVLLSGGGSALLPLAAEGITLEDLAALTGLLLGCGAAIDEINVVRKHCSQVAGGQLARLAAPAQMAALILSDVVGTPLDAIASGPTVADRSNFAAALEVLRRHEILDEAPNSVRRHLERGAAGEILDTPKPGDPMLGRVNNVVIGDNAMAARAAADAARQQGWHTELLTTFLQGEAREVGKVMAGLAQGIAAGSSDLRRPACLVLGGETTVTLRGQGRGGRNQELALAAAIALDEYRLLGGDGAIVVAALATDGNDGPTDAAGGLVQRDTVARGRALGLDARAALASNDSYAYLAALDSLLVSGPTDTNVNDLLLIAVI